MQIVAARKWRKPDGLGGGDEKLKRLDVFDDLDDLKQPLRVHLVI